MQMHADQSYQTLHQVLATNMFDQLVQIARPSLAKPLVSPSVSLVVQLAISPEFH